MIFCGRCDTWVENLEEHDRRECTLIQEVKEYKRIDVEGLRARIDELENENDELTRINGKYNNNLAGIRAIVNDSE